MLRDYVDTPLSAEEIGDLLTMAGFELEEIEIVEGEKVLNVNIMANRGDGPSVVSLAREVLAKSDVSRKTELFERAEVRFHSADEADSSVSQLATVEIQTDNCTRYACRVFEDVHNGASPGWLQDRLWRIGQRPISLLVDLSNIVMFETGQPLHAFDLDKLSGNKIVVRQASSRDKKFTTLDEVVRLITPEDMMICDAVAPVAIAGVMGGLSSEVGVTTKRMLLESANFDHKSVRNTRTRLGLATEASSRFERYVDPEQAVSALNRFAELYEAVTGEWSARGVIDVYPSPPVRTQIMVRLGRCCMLLGMDVSQSDAVKYLQRLGFEVVENPGILFCTPPTWRNDVEREDDVIEEIGRIHGYEKIPELLPRGETTRGGVFGADAKIDQVREELLRCGLTQSISHSLRDLHVLDAPGERIRVRQPHSPEIAHLRNSNLPCLADVAHRNGLDNLHLFEIGKVFYSGREQFGLGILSVGGDRHEDWQKKNAPHTEFFEVKEVLERVCSTVGVSASFVAPNEPDGRFHPTRVACIVDGERSVGILGQIHPVAAQSCGLRAETILAEVDLDALVGAPEQEKHFRPVSKNPAVRRDIAILVKQQVSYEEISRTVSSACGEVLEKQWLFDVYQGKGIKKGFHSLAIALQLRKPGENFTDEEANQVRDRAVAALESLGATLR